MSKATYNKEVYDHLLSYSRRKIKPGDTIYTVTRHLSRSRKTKHVDVFYIDRENEKVELKNIQYEISVFFGYRTSKNYNGLVVTNTGNEEKEMVFKLSSLLFKGEKDAGKLLKHRWF